MIINHEVPIACIRQATFNDYGYALAHNFENEDYRRYFAELSESQLVYLDNSAFELGESVPADYLKKCAGALSYRCMIFLPDVRNDSKETIKRSQEFIKHLPDCECWGVIQGRDLDEQMECLDKMLELTYNIAVPYGGPDRVAFMGNASGILRRNNARVHLLGLRSMHELKQLRNNDIVFSIDTSLPVVTGIKGVELNMDTPKDPTMVWDLNVSALPAMVYRNADFFRKIALGDGD